MRDFSSEMAEIVSRIPVGTFECEPGCTDCCSRHTWTWAEWKQLPDDMRRNVSHIEARCPYATAKGCECYDNRPSICRMYGLADGIGKYGPFKNVTLKCPKGLEPTTKLSKSEARSIFLAAMEIRDKEVKERIRSGAWPLFAGPYGRIMSEAYAKGQSI